MTKTRALGNRKTMNLGSLTFDIRDGTGDVKIATEFYLMDSTTQLDLLDDWINLLERLYKMEQQHRGSLRGTLQEKRPRRTLRVIPDFNSKDYE